MTRAKFAAVLVAAGLSAGLAHGQNWIGATSDWNTASNWSPAGVPNGPSVAVSFSYSALSTNTVNISSSVQAQSLTFSDPSRSYTLTSSASQMLSSVTAITVATSAVLTDTINLANIATGSLLMPSSGSLTIAENSTSTGSLLVIGPNTVIGASGGGGAVTVTGVDNVTISGSFATSPNAVSGGLTKTGAGKLILNGNGTNLAGGLTLNAGILQLDYSSNTNSKLGGGALTLNAGQLNVVANTTNSVTQIIPGGTMISQNQTDIVGSSAGGGTVTLALGNITRTQPGTFDISIGAGNPTFTATTTTGAINGLLGSGTAFATVSGGSTWATVSSGAIAGLASYGTDSYASGVNTDVTSSYSAPAAFTTNSLRFNTGTQTITLSGTNILQSGGILVTPNAAGGTITGGALTVPGAGELIVPQYSSTSFTIASNVTAPAGLTKTGPGTLILGGNNTGLTGPINISRGSLDVTNPAAVNSASAINFNDARTPVGQTFTVDLGVSASGTISTPIQLSTPYANQNNTGTLFSAGNSYNSHVILSGVISSAPGLNTPIFFVGDPINSSETDLTNANTFTGNLALLHSILGITSDASLGNPANTLSLDIGSTTTGGLEFLNSGITVARPIILGSVTRIISNGTANNTISGQITGTGGFAKDGTGAVVLTNLNAFTGTVTVTAGTLSLGATGALNGVLSTYNNIVVMSGATFQPATAAGSSQFGVVTLNGGTFQVPGGTGQQYRMTQIVINAPGGTVDFSAAGSDVLQFNGGNTVEPTINANSTWFGAANGSSISIGNAGTFPISVAPGVTLTNGLGLTSPAATLQLTGGGTLFQNSVSSPGASVTASVTVTQSIYRVTDVSSASGVGNLGTGTFTLDGGTLDYGGSSATTIKPIALTLNGATIQVEFAATVLTENGAITGPAGLTKIGAGTLVLGSSGNTFTSLTITGGTVQTAADNTLGPNPGIVVNAAGTLQYTANTSTARTFNLNFGTLQAASGATLTLNGAAINGGFVAGPGTYAVTGGAALSGATTYASTPINVTGAGSFTNFTNGGPVTVAAGPASATTFTRFTNQGSGAITVAAGSTLNVADFQTYGMLTLTPNTTASPTILTNTGTTPLNFNGGSQTFIGTPATADPTGQNILDYVDLHGNNAIVAGGLFVNNGGVYDTVGAGTGTIIAEFGALVKGAGFYQNTVKTQNGGKFQTGNSPGSATFGNFVFGPGGVSNYIFAIDDATGQAGPSPNAAGLVSGWGLIKAVQVSLGTGATSGNFTWTATPSNPLTVAIDTLVNPTMVGTDVAGPMADFDPTQSYSWTAAHWSGTYSGPADAATLDADTTFDTTGFANPMVGTFGWSLDSADQTLSLVYTPSAVPEPGTLALTALAGLAWAGRRRRRKSLAVS